MQKFKEFLKRYGFYFGIAFVIIVVILLIIFGNFKEEEKPVIEAPFVSGSKVRYTMRNNFSDFSDTVPVYKADTFSEAEVLELFKTLDLEEFERTQTTDSTVIWEKDEKRAVWSIKDGVLNITIPEGFNLEIEREGTLNENYTEEYFNEFSSQYLKDLPQIDISDIRDNGDNYVVDAQYKKDNVNIASSRLDGTSLSVQFTEFGELEKLSILLIKNIRLEREYPSINFELISTYVNNENFPSSVSYEVTDSEYDELPVSLRISTELKDVYLEESEKIWIFVDNEYDYIVPVYRMFGEGIVQDTQEETYEADATVMFCVIDPSYLKKKEVSNEPVESPDEDILNNDETDHEKIEEDLLFDPVGTSE